jgi:dTDP-glucose pyrophosphorylase
MFTLAVIHACHLVQPSDSDEYETSSTIGPLLQLGRTIDAISFDGRRVDVGYPEDREEADARLTGESNRRTRSWNQPAATDINEGVWSFEASPLTCCRTTG